MTPTAIQLAETHELLHLARKRADGAEARELELRAEVKRLTLGRNEAYAERNKVVVALARMARELGWPLGVADDKEAEPRWQTVVFIDLPNGQVSWHFSETECALLLGFPDYKGTYDGHTTEEKYRRLGAPWVTE